MAGWLAPSPKLPLCRAPDNLCNKGQNIFAHRPKYKTFVHYLLHPAQNEPLATMLLPPLQSPPSKVSSASSCGLNGP
ncbi:bacteriophage regulatory protein [Sesbania bispinosa]|nr:bacteriophage regulatory protein [Sesbania bispinosa]